MPTLRKQWFLFALVAMLLGGTIGHAALRDAADMVPRAGLVAAILLAMSCPIDLARSLATRSAVGAAVIAILINALVAGPLALLAGLWLDKPLAIGLVVAALAPCTIASAAVWTRRGGGNEAVALTVTVVTSLLTVLVLPAGLRLLVGQTAVVSGAALAVRLLLIVVLPIALGQLLRCIPPLRSHFDCHRKGIGATAQLGLLGMVFVGAVRSGELLASPTTRPALSDGAMLLGLAAAVHLVLFGLSWGIAQGSGCKRADSLAAAVAGSQKTLTVGLDVAMQLGGLVLLPAIVYHTVQLLLDTVLVDWLRRAEGASATPPPGGSDL